MPEAQTPQLSLHYRLLGETGPTVVLIHGLVMDNLSSWYFTVAHTLAETHQVLLYDLRGHGRSGRPTEGYDLHTHLTDLLHLLDHLGWHDPTHLIGNSFGGMVAIAFALTHPDRVASLALVDGLIPEQGWGARMADTLQLTGEARDHKIAEAFSDWAGRHSDRKRNRLAEQAHWLTTATTLLTDLRREPGFTRQQLASLPQPVLGLYGADSDVLDAGERLLRSLPDGRLLTWPDCGHALLWQHTQELCGELAAWLEGQP